MPTQPRSNSPPPLKRPRRAPSPAHSDTNGHTLSNEDSNLPPLSLSILGIEPLDEFIKEIADFVHHMIMTRPEHLNGKIEVEAKIGILRDRTSGQRLALPVLVETILAPGSTNVLFESNMTIHKHKHYNTLLNRLKSESSLPSHIGSPLDYSHRHLIDTFYALEGNDRDKIRVTRDEKTGTTLECMRKMRLGDLNIHSPKHAVDWRLSVNLEVPMQLPEGTTPTHTRRKDRVSYSHEEFNIDLTQVTSSASPNAPQQILHELELEIARPEFLQSTAMKRNDTNYPEHEQYAFDELIRAFVNNARILVRNSNEGWQ